MQPFRDLAVGTRSLGEAMINIQYPLDSFLMNASVGKLVLYWRILWAVHEPMHCPRVKPNCPIALYQLNPPVLTGKYFLTSWSSVRDSLDFHQAMRRVLAGFPNSPKYMGG